MMADIRGACSISAAPFASSLSIRSMPIHIYAGTEALWRSSDDGATWNLVWPRPSTVRGVRMSSDHADETILSDDDPVGQIVCAGDRSG